VLVAGDMNSCAVEAPYELLTQAPSAQKVDRRRSSSSHRAGCLLSTGVHARVSWWAMLMFTGGHLQMDRYCKHSLLPVLVIQLPMLLRYASHKYMLLLLLQQQLLPLLLLPMVLLPHTGKRTFRTRWWCLSAAARGVRGVM
jgi:hypothetical protein